MAPPVLSLGQRLGNAARVLTGRMQAMPLQTAANAPPLAPPHQPSNQQNQQNQAPPWQQMPWGVAAPATSGLTQAPPWQQMPWGVAAPVTSGLTGAASPYAALAASAQMAALSPPPPGFVGESQDWVQQNTNQAQMYNSMDNYVKTALNAMAIEDQRAQLNMAAEWRKVMAEAAYQAHRQSDDIHIS